MRALLLVLFALAVPLVPAASAEENAEARIRQAIALHDAGRFDEAIAIYKDVLAKEPSNTFASYELALSLQGKGDHAQCRTVAAQHADKEGPLQPAFLTTLGNCLDMGGDHEQAIVTFRKGLTLAPEDPMLLYNLGVTLWGQRKYAESRELLKKELAIAVNHASGHYALGKVFETENFRAAALLSYLRFLALEPSSSRSKEAATSVLVLLNLGIEQKDQKNVTINVDPDSPKGEGDFSAWEMMLGFSAATRTLPENRRRSEFDLTREQLTTALRMLMEMRADLGSNYSASRNVPFFAALEEKKLLDTYAAVALSSLALKGGDRWLKKNDAAIKAYVAFMQASMQGQGH
jgi:tetratricopeptide (TPR) repeat protein